MMIVILLLFINENEILLMCCILINGSNIINGWYVMYLILYYNDINDMCVEIKPILMMWY